MDEPSDARPDGRSDAPAAEYQEPGGAPLGRSWPPPAGWRTVSVPFQCPFRRARHDKRATSPGPGSGLTRPQAIVPAGPLARRGTDAAAMAVRENFSQ